MPKGGRGFGAISAELRLAAGGVAGILFASKGLVLGNGLVVVNVVGSGTCMVILPGPTQSAGGLASAVGVMVFACVAVGVVPGTGMLLPVASKTPEALAFLLVGIVAGGGMLILPVASKAPEALASIVVGVARTGMLISRVASNAPALALEPLPETVPA